MNITDIKLGETYNYYWHDSHGSLKHSTVEAIKINAKSVRVRHKDSMANELEFRVDPSELDNRQIEAF